MAIVIYLPESENLVLRMVMGAPFMGKKIGTSRRHLSDNAKTNLSFRRNLQH